VGGKGWGRGEYILWMSYWGNLGLLENHILSNCKKYQEEKYYLSKY
jgi:hypothetical protein